MVAKSVVLVILDGFGAREHGEDNAIALASTPHWDRLRHHYPYTTLNASEVFVGLPEKQFGNSEVGHLNLGSGRVVQQDIGRIDQALNDGSLAQHARLRIPLDYEGNIHIIGLLSDGGVHAHERHIHGLIKIARAQTTKNVYSHAFLDGRDTPPKSAGVYLKKLEELSLQYDHVYLASLCGRYYAMDRDHRWERTEKAYKLITSAHGIAYSHWNEALEAFYAQGIDDEFMEPCIFPNYVAIKEHDSVWFANFRSDRARQLTEAFRSEHFCGFDRGEKIALARWVTMTEYSQEFTDEPLFPQETIQDTLGEWISKHGLHQLRIAETEKYPHVTYFFNGGKEEAFKYEERVLIPSPRVATYDIQPEMSAHIVCTKLQEAIKSKKFALIVCNFANADMIGHTGNLSATIAAVETLDQCLGKITSATLESGAELMITADHGNCERMFDREHNQAHTQHTFDPVPFLYVGHDHEKIILRQDGSLRDVAPTILKIMGLDIPNAMTGNSLIL
jgi:2,3-bisphosphoglycerate-independent phosphoglycerate mutase